MTQLMNGRLIKAAQNKYVCRPGRYIDEDGHIGFIKFWFGDMWECDCGLMYVAVHSSNPGQAIPVWRLETKRERKQRVKNK